MTERLAPDAPDAATIPARYAHEALARLFDRFWQTDGHGGAGLGLAIVRGVMEAHGGVFDVLGEKG